MQQKVKGINSRWGKFYSDPFDISELIESTINKYDNDNISKSDLDLKSELGLIINESTESCIIVNNPLQFHIHIDRLFHLLSILVPII